MREPSLHISESNLAKLISMILRDDPKILPKDLAKQLLLLGRKHALSGRKLLATNEKQRKAASRVSNSSLEDAMMMAKIIHQIRRQLKHRGIDIPKVGSVEFNSIKETTKNATEFQSLFLPDENIHSAFKTYIETSLGIMTKFNTLRLPALHNKIMDAYEAQQRLLENDNVEYTDRAYKSYNKRVLDTVGTILVDYKKIPDKYQKFMEVAEVCKKLKITPEIYIEAQFEGLKWANAIPEPSQLVGDKANERLQKYLFENQVQIRDNNREVNNDKINRMKDILKNK